MVDLYYIVNTIPEELYKHLQLENVFSLQKVSKHLKNKIDQQIEIVLRVGVPISSLEIVNKFVKYVVKKWGQALIAKNWAIFTDKSEILVTFLGSIWIIANIWGQLPQNVKNKMLLKVIESDDVATAIYMLENGCNNYTTALFRICSTAKCEGLIDYLVDLGTPMEHALSGATINGHKDIVKILLRKGASFRHFKLQKLAICKDKSIKNKFSEMIMEVGAKKIFG